MVRDRAGRAARHRILERPQASVCLGAQTAPSRATSFRYCGNTKCNTHLADAPLSRKSYFLVNDGKMDVWPVSGARPMLGGIKRGWRQIGRLGPLLLRHGRAWLPG